jgi:cysteine desulfurase
MSKNIYLDNAATTKLNPEVLDEMMPYLKDMYGNASSIYSIGRESRKAVDTARDRVAKALSANSSEIFFTSG